MRFVRSSLVFGLFAACTPGAGGGGGTDNFDAQIDGNADAENDGTAEISSTDPRMCVTDDGRIYVAWVDNRGGDYIDVWLTRSDDGGSSWNAPVQVKQGNGDASDPDLACNGDRVYLVWEDTRDSAVGYTNIYMNYSNDAGETWMKKDRQIDVFDPSGNTISLGPKIVFRGPNVHIVWYDQKEGAPDIYINSSSNEGKTWEVENIQRLSGAKLNKELDPGGAGLSWSGNPVIAMDAEGIVHVAWEDTYWATANPKEAAAQDIFYTRSKNKSAKAFQTWTRISSGVNQGKNLSFAPSMAVSPEGYVYLVWMDNRNGRTKDGDTLDVYANYSADGGNSWLPEPIRLDPDDIGNAAQSRYPKVISEGNVAHVVWQDKFENTYSIYYRRLVDGVPEESYSRINAGETRTGQVNDLMPVLASREGTMVASWQGQRRNTEGGFNELYYNYSSTTGTIAWHGSDWRLDTVRGGTSQSKNLSIDTINGDVIAVWQDARQGPLTKRPAQTNWSIFFSHAELGHGVTTAEEYEARRK